MYTMLPDPLSACACIGGLGHETSMYVCMNIYNVYCVHYSLAHTLSCVPETVVAGEVLSYSQFFLQTFFV